MQSSMLKEPKSKTLLVEFAPRGKDSKTKALRTYFTDIIKDYTELEELDLCKNPPDLLNQERLKLYYKRNYLGKKLTSIESLKLSGIDQMRDQLIEKEFLIISSPMYNFGFPATVKAWIDAVMQRGYAFTSDENGHIPLLRHLKVIIIYTSGMVYDQISDNQNWNGLVAESDKLFRFMGVTQLRIVHIQGIDMLPEYNIKVRTENVAKRKLNTIAKDWFRYPYPLEVYEHLN